MDLPVYYKSTKKNGTGMVHGAFNMVGNAFSAVSASSARSNLFNKSLVGLQIGIRESFELLLDEIGRIITQDVQLDKLKEKTIIQYIKDGSFGKDFDLRDPFAEAFQAFPFDEELYVAYIQLYPEDEQKMMAMAKDIGMDLEEVFYNELHFNGFVFHSILAAAYVKSIEIPFLQQIDLLAKEYDKKTGHIPLSQKLFNEVFLMECNSVELVNSLSENICITTKPASETEMPEYFKAWDSWNKNGESRANMLNPSAREMGMNSYYDPATQKRYWVQIFRG